MISKKRRRYITTIIANSKDGIHLHEVYGYKSVENQKRDSIKLRNGKLAAIVIISTALIGCGFVAIMYNPSFTSDMFLSIFSGLLTGLVLLLYSGYNERLRNIYSLKVNNLENVSRDISNILTTRIFIDLQDVINETPKTLNTSCTEDNSIITQTNDICQLVIKLNGNEDIAWLNKKNKYAKEMYSNLLIYACIMQNSMGTAIVKPSIESDDEKSIDKQEIYDYIIKTSSDLSQYKRIIDKILFQIKQQIIKFDKSIL